MTHFTGKWSTLCNPLTFVPLALMKAGVTCAVHNLPTKSQPNYTDHIYTYSIFHKRVYSSLLRCLFFFFFLRVRSLVMISDLLLSRDSSVLKRTALISRRLRVQLPGWLLGPSARLRSLKSSAFNGWVLVTTSNSCLTNLSINLNNVLVVWEV